MKPTVIRSRHAEWACLALIALLFSAFYLWTADPTGAGWKNPPTQGDYYNLLVDGYLSGHLHMDIEPDPALASLSDPYEPDNRRNIPYLHDATYYKGHYYLYFGSVPAVVSMLPFKVLTGRHLPMGNATAVFACLGLGGILLLWRWIWDRQFRRSGIQGLITGALIAVLCSVVPVTLRRAEIYELPIIAASAFLVWSLFFLMKAAETGRLRHHFLAGLMLSLSIGSRMNYLILMPVLGLPTLLEWLRSRTEPSRALPWCVIVKRASAAALPLALMGLLLAWHNYARFGNPLQFGQIYQFTGMAGESKLQHFSLSFVPFNAYAYLLQPPDLGWHFPFIYESIRNQASVPAGYGGIELVLPYLVCWPAALFLFAAPLLLLQGQHRTDSIFPGLLASLGFCGIGMLAFMTCFFGATGRYTTDFAPALALLAAIGAVGGLNWLSSHQLGRATLLGNAATWTLIVLTAFTSLLLNLTNYGVYRDKDPASYYKAVDLIERMNPAGHLVDGTDAIGIQLALRFPSQPRPDRPESLLSIGHAAGSEHLFIQYQGGDLCRLAYAQQGTPPSYTESLSLTRLAREGIRFFPASLPSVHTKGHETSAWFGVQVGEQIVLEGPASPGINREIRPGYDLQWGDYGRSFSGSLKVSAIPTGQLPAQLINHQIDNLVLLLPTQPRAKREILGRLTRPGADDLRLILENTESGAWTLFVSQGINDTPLATIPPPLPGSWRTLSLMQSGHAPGSKCTRLSIILDGTRQPGVFEFEGEPGCLELRDDALSFALPRFSGVAGFQKETKGAAKAPASGLIGTRLRLTLPPYKPNASDPLAVLGHAGAADILVLAYVSDHQLRIGFDQWGGTEQWGPTLEVNYATPLEVELYADSLPLAGSGQPSTQGELLVTINGRTAYRHQGPLYVPGQNEVFLLRNPVHASSCTELFTGTLLQVEHLYSKPAQPKQ